MSFTGCAYVHAFATVAAIAIATGACAGAGAALPPPLTPSGAGARLYRSAPADEDRAPAASAADDRLRRALVADAAALARRAGHPAPDADRRLDSAMTDLARHLRGDDLPALEVVDFLLAHYGIIEPSPHLLMIRSGVGGDDELRKSSASHVTSVLKRGPVGRIGVGIDRVGDLVYLVVALQEKHLEVDPVPRRLRAGGVAVLMGKVSARFREPHVVVTGPDGSVRELETQTRSENFRSDIPCAGNGRYQVELTALDASGTTVLANFPIYCGVAPPVAAPRTVGVAPGAVTVAAAEAQMVELVNRDRKAAGLRPVVPDARLADIARAHSRDMAENDFVGHISPRTGAAIDRAQRAGLKPLLIMENVGRAYSADEAERGFMTSPGHRGNVLDRRARRVGIGIAFGAPVTGTLPLFVTQLFTP